MITKADPNSPFWTACREACERHERRVTTEQELAELRRELEALADTLDEGADESEDFNNGFMEAADLIREVLARKPGAPGHKTDRERASLTSNPYYDEADHILEAAEQAYDINPLPSTPRKAPNE